MVARVEVQTDIACDLALIEVLDGGGTRHYRIQDLFSPIDLSELEESEEVLDQIEQQLMAQVPRCRVVR